MMYIPNFLHTWSPTFRVVDFLQGIFQNLGRWSLRRTGEIFRRHSKLEAIGPPSNRTTPIASPIFPTHRQDVFNHRSLSLQSLSASQVSLPVHSSTMARGRHRGELGQGGWPRSIEERSKTRSRALCTSKIAVQGIRSSQSTGTARNYVVRVRSCWVALLYVTNLSYVDYVENPLCQRDTDVENSYSSQPDNAVL